MRTRASSGKGLKPKPSSLLRSGSGTLGFCVEIEAQGNEPVEFDAALRNWAYGSKPNKIQHYTEKLGLR